MQIQHDDLTGQPVQTGEVNELPVLQQAAPFQILFVDESNLAVGASVQSAWFDAEALAIDSLLLARRSAGGGTYAFEIDWSVDGAVAAITEAVTVPNNDSIVKHIASRFFRTRVRNTDAVTAFTDHATVVHGRFLGDA